MGSGGPLLGPYLDPPRAWFPLLCCGFGVQNGPETGPEMDHFGVLDRSIGVETPEMTYFGPLLGPLLDPSGEVLEGPSDQRCIMRAQRALRGHNGSYGALEEHHEHRPSGYLSRRV